MGLILGCSESQPTAKSGYGGGDAGGTDSAAGETGTGGAAGAGVGGGTSAAGTGGTSVGGMGGSAGTPQLPPGLLQPSQLNYVGDIGLKTSGPIYGLNNSDGATAYNPAGDPNGATDGWSGSLYVYKSTTRRAIWEVTLPPPDETNPPNVSVLHEVVMDAECDAEVGASGKLGGPGFDGSHVYATSYGYYTQQHAATIWRFDEDLGGKTPLGMIGPASAHVSGSYDPTWNPKKWAYVIFNVPDPFCADVLGGNQCMASGGSGDPIRQMGGGGGATVFSWNPADLSDASALQWSGCYNSTVGEADKTPPGMPAMPWEHCPRTGTSAEGERCTSCGRADTWHAATWIDHPVGAAVLQAASIGLSQAFANFSTGESYDWFDTCYGNPADCNAVLCKLEPGVTYGRPVCGDLSTMGSSAKGNHGDPYQPFLFFYDPAELAAAKAGSQDPWAIAPYAWIDLLSLKRSDGTTPVFRPDDYRWPIGGLTFADLSGTLYLFVSEKNGTGGSTIYPVIHVFRVDSS